MKLDESIKLESNGMLVGILFYHKIEFGMNNYGYQFISVFYEGNCIYKFVSDGKLRIDYDNRFNFINIIG